MAHCLPCSLHNSGCSTGIYWYSPYIGAQNHFPHLLARHNQVALHYYPRGQPSPSIHFGLRLSSWNDGALFLHTGTARDGDDVLRLVGCCWKKLRHSRNGSRAAATTAISLSCCTHHWIRARQSLALAQQARHLVSAPSNRCDHGWFAGRLRAIRNWLSVPNRGEQCLWPSIRFATSYQDCLKLYRSAVFDSVRGVD